MLVAVLAATGCRGVENEKGQPPAASGAGTTRDPWTEARGRGIDFRALGQEPGWFLEIDEGQSIRLVYDYGERTVTMPAPPPAVTSGRTTYSSRADAQALTVVIDERRCEDVMSGEGFSHTVTVTLDARELRGCGRSLR